MKCLYVAAALLAFASPTMAQQQQITPSQIAVQIGSAVNNMAIALENNQRTIADLQKQIADLKAKYEPAAKK